MPINKKLAIILGSLLGIVLIGGGVFITVHSLTGVKITLLDNEGVMIEAKGTRIYIDPQYLESQFSPKPADVVCVTHPHADHYYTPFIDGIQHEETINIFPATMTDAVTLFDGVGVAPGDEVVISDAITITAFYMYTDEALHPKSNNWTSYLIDIDGFIIYHAGDSMNMSEYDQLTGLVDLAMLPYVTGFLMTNTEIVNAINTIQPVNAMLIHDDLAGYTSFYEGYGDQITTNFILLDHYDSMRFR